MPVESVFEILLNAVTVCASNNKIKTVNVSLDLSIANTKPLHFGMYGDTWSGWYPLNGDLDDIRFYKRLLSDAEMKALYQEGEAGSVQQRRAARTRHRRPETHQDRAGEVGRLVEWTKK